jgi:hypothetical protein
MKTIPTMLISGDSAGPFNLRGALALSLEQSLALESEAIWAEAMGWLPLDAGAYFHQGLKPESEEAVVIEVVGIPSFEMAGMNVLLLV